MTLTILSTETRAGKLYVLFRRLPADRTWLFLRDPGTGNQSLLFGPDKLEGEYHEVTADPRVTCVECALAGIRGGVALDGGDVVDSRLSIPEANRLLSQLRRQLPDLAIPPFPT